MKQLKLELVEERANNEQLLGELDQLKQKLDMALAGDKSHSEGGENVPLSTSIEQPVKSLKLRRNSNPSNPPSPRKALNFNPSKFTHELPENEFDLELQLFSWMFIALKLQFTLMNSPIEWVDKNDLYDYLLLNRVSIKQWPQLIIEALTNGTL